VEEFCRDQRFRGDDLSQVGDAYFRIVQCFAQAQNSIEVCRENNLAG
jgi:hypothetical protein